MSSEWIEKSFDTNLFDIAIYRNVDLDNHRGVDPEFTLVNHVSPALADIGINHRIRWNFDPIPISNNNNGCPPGDVAYTAWSQYLDAGNAPWVAADCNILINNSRGGGCGSVGGNVCVGPGWRIDGRYERVLSGGAGWQWHVYSCMHEIGHNMGFPHSPNPGLKWVADDDRLHITPTNGDPNQTSNMCGTSVDLRPDNGLARVPENWFAPCVADHLIIRGPAPSEVPDPEPPGNGDEPPLTPQPRGSVARSAVTAAAVGAGAWLLLGRPSRAEVESWLGGGPR